MQMRKHGPKITSLFSGYTYHKGWTRSKVKYFFESFKINLLQNW